MWMRVFQATTFTNTPSLSHHHSHTITLTPSLSPHHSHHHTRTITLTPSHSHRHTNTITLTSSLSHHHTHKEVSCDEDHVSCTDSEVASQHRDVHCPLPYLPQRLATELRVVEGLTLLHRQLQPLHHVVFALQHQLHRVHTVREGGRGGGGRW